MASYKKTNSPIFIADHDIREMANEVAACENKMVTTMCSEILRDSLKVMIGNMTARSQQQTT